MAHNLKQKGFPVVAISAITGLTEEEISSLQTMNEDEIFEGLFMASTGRG